MICSTCGENWPPDFFEMWRESTVVPRMCDDCMKAGEEDDNSESDKVDATQTPRVS